MYGNALRICTERQTVVSLHIAGFWGPLASCDITGLVTVAKGERKHTTSICRELHNSCSVLTEPCSALTAPHTLRAGPQIPNQLCLRTFLLLDQRATLYPTFSHSLGFSVLTPQDICGSAQAFSKPIVPATVARGESGLPG